MRDLRGLVGWPGEFMGGWGGGRDCRGRGSLGSGATRTWPPPWPLLGLPPPVGQRGQNRVRPSEAPPTVQNPPSGGKGGVPHLVGLGLAVLRVVLLVCLCLGILLCLLGLLVLLLIVHSLFFLQGGGEEHRRHPRRGGEQSHSGRGSLTFAAFLAAFGSGLGWGGFYDNNRKESSNCRT